MTVLQLRLALAVNEKLLRDACVRGHLGDILRLTRHRDALRSTLVDLLLTTKQAA